MFAEHQKDSSLTALATRCAVNLIERQKQDGSIDFDRLPDVPKPIDKVWLIGWGCDCALTLMTVADGSA